MAITPGFTIQGFRAQCDEALKRLDEAILLNFRYLGEQCVNIARKLDTYRDVTGNLRSSIGYVIVKDGQIVESNFKRMQNRKDGKRRDRGYGKSGVQSGMDFAREIARNYPTGFALIIVAGMAYAAKVESSGKDVLTSSEQYVNREMPKLIKRLNRALAKVNTQ